MESSKELSNNYKLARYFYKRGDFEQARRYLEAELSQTHPCNEHALQLYWEYTLCLYKLGELADALAKVEEGLSKYPDCREFFYIKGQIYYEMGLLRYSRDYFSKFIAIKTSFLDCDDGVAVNYRAFGYLTAISVRAEKFEEALDYLRLFILETPDISALNKVCLLLLKSGLDENVLIQTLITNNVIPNFDLVRLLLTNQAYEACNEKEACGELGRERTQSERSLSPHQVPAQEYHRLGIICGSLGFYEQAAEYFLRAAVLEPGNQVYPCLIYEALSIKAIEILVAESDPPRDSPILKNELLRLATLKRKSKRLRQIIMQQGNGEKAREDIYGRFDVWSLGDDMGEEAAWNINV